MGEIPHMGFFLQQAGGRAFNVKTAHGVALGHGFLGIPVIFRLPGRFIQGTIVLFQVDDGVSDHP